MASAIQASQTLWHNGKHVPWESARIHVLSHGLHYGSAVFEGIRCYGQADGGRAIFQLDRHLQRLLASARVLRMKITHPLEELREACLETIRRNNLRDAYLRPIVYHGYGFLNPAPGDASPIEVAIAAFDWPPLFGKEARDRGINVCVSSWRRNAPGTMPAMAKISGAYPLSQLIAMEAQRLGFDEGIALDVFGHVAECSGANVFLVYEDELYTPPLDASILPGITRSSVITLARDLGYPVREERIPREMLYMCQELFLTGTAAEISFVTAIDGMSVGSGARGPITTALLDVFSAAVRGERPDHHHWLTRVEA